MVDSQKNPAWKYSKDGEKYYADYYTLFLINNSKKKIMSILNKITDDTFTILSSKFVNIISVDIVYTEQANEVVKYLLKKIINIKFMTLYANLCKMIINNNKLYSSCIISQKKKETFQTLLINTLQNKYNQLLKEKKENKGEIILLTTFICRLYTASVISAAVIKHILMSLFDNIYQSKNCTTRDYYIEIICNLLFNLSNNDELIKSSIEKIVILKEERKNKDRIYILILNLEEEYSKKWMRKKRNEKSVTLTKKNKKDIQIQKERGKENQKHKRHNKSFHPRQYQGNSRNFSHH
jgi:hypothetical protein